MIERTEDGEAFHYELQSSVRSMSYDFRERRGRLDLEALCCSMTGAIAMFVAIDQEVQRIETFAGRHAGAKHRSLAGLRPCYRPCRRAELIEGQPRPFRFALAIWLGFVAEALKGGAGLVSLQRATRSNP